MARQRFELRSIFANEKPVLGAVLLQPLPGAPRFGGDLEAVIAAAVGDAQSFERAGLDGVTLENVGDNPFVRDEATPETIAAFTAVARAVRAAVSLPLGINVMRNSWRAAMAIAATAGASYIRVNVFGDALVTDQGIIEGCAAQLVRFRKYLGAEQIAIFADVDCKHAAPLAARPLELLARDTVYRQMADALLLTGPDSDTPPLPDHLTTVKAAVPDVPVLIASGMSPEHSELLALCDGTTLGAYARGWQIDAPVDPERVQLFLESARGVRAYA